MVVQCTMHKYLGSMMASSSGDLKEGKGLHGQLFGSWNVCGDAPASQSLLRLRYLKTTCVTVLLCSCQSGRLLKAMESGINAFVTSCYRIVLNIKIIDRVSNATVYGLTQAAQLVENVRTHYLRFRPCT